MKEYFLIVLSDIGPEEFRKLYINDELPNDLQVIKIDYQPTFIDSLNIDNLGISNKEWKHVLKVKDHQVGFEVLDLITTFGKSFGNVELFN